MPSPVMDRLAKAVCLCQVRDSLWWQLFANLVVNIMAILAVADFVGRGPSGRRWVACRGTLLASLQTDYVGGFVTSLVMGSLMASLVLGSFQGENSEWAVS